MDNWAIHYRSVILVAHHEDSIRSRVATTLGAEGNLVLCASDGYEALAVSQKHDGAIDLAVTDVTMPELGGSDLCSRLLRERPGIRILVISGTGVRDLADPRAILAAPRVSTPYVYMIFFGSPPQEAGREMPACVGADRGAG